MTIAEDLAQRSGIDAASAGEVIRYLEMFGLIDREAIRRAERDAKIYELRACMNVPELAARFDITVCRVNQIIKKELAIRRGA